MTRCSKFVLTGLVGFVMFLGGSEAQAQGVQVDANRAARGKQVWMRDGCYMCHAFGRPLAGPDLAGVTERRDPEWLKRWLKETNEMLGQDPQARAMLEQFKGARMPQVKLNDSDIEALIHFMAQETQRTRQAA